MAYATAYIGIATARNGDFDHFVRQLRTSHLLGGYWRFQSIDDDRRAMARGFTTPEDVLCAADTSEDDFDEIFIRWVRGANDPNIKMALAGTPMQHLQTIYELRALLGLPMSSRGRVPLYPISTKPILRQYWEAKYRAQRPVLINPTSELPGRPISSPVTPRPEHSSSSRLQHAAPEVSKIPAGRITRAASAKKSQAAQPTPAAKSIPARRGPDAHTALKIKPSAVPPLSGGSVVPSLPTNTFGQQKVVFQNTAPPASTLVPSASSGSSIVPSIPRAALKLDLNSSPLPPRSGHGYGVSQYNWVHLLSRDPGMRYTSSPAPLQNLGQPNTVRDHTLDPTVTHSEPTIPSKAPYRSLNPASGTQDGLLSEAHTRKKAGQWASTARKSVDEGSRGSNSRKNTSNGHVKPVTAPSTSRLAGNKTERHVAVPCSATDLVVSTTYPPANSFSSSIAAPMTPPAFSHDTSTAQVPTSPYVPQDLLPKTPTRNSQENFLENLSSPPASLLSPPPPHIEAAAAGTPVATQNNPTGTHDRPVPAGLANRLPSENHTSLQRNLGQHNMSSLDADDTNGRGESAEAWCTFMKELEQLPCMDCGENDGHKWGCHLGNIIPMQNLTMLDYRMLTDAVERFDPGPWTTHFHPPEPELEDAETQIRGMAEVIRNEDSYKDDEELHQLPDEFMIILWAFKTSENVRVVNEKDCYSSIDEAETE